MELQSRGFLKVVVNVNAQTPWPSFSYKPSNGFKKLILMNFPASEVDISVVLERLLDCESGITGKPLHGFDVVLCMRLFSLLTLLTVM